MAKKNTVVIADEILVDKIYELRDEKVMLDRDLAELYGVETKYLKRQVKRNLDRFPKDFMFELNEKEDHILRCQFGTSKPKRPENSGRESDSDMENRGGSRYLPMAFTEQGVAQLSSVLNSPRAIAVNIQIIRLFTRMRKLMRTHKDILMEMEEIKMKVNDHDGKIQAVFGYLQKFIKKQEETEQRLLIGFKRKKKN